MRQLPMPNAADPHCVSVAAVEDTNNLRHAGDVVPPHSKEDRVVIVVYGHEQTHDYDVEDKMMMTELARLKRIKNKAKACVKGSKTVCLPPGGSLSTETTIPPYLLDALAEEIEKYEKSLKKKAK